MSSACCNGVGDGAEKHQELSPPSIAVIAPDDVPDAGLRGLDHCTELLSIACLIVVAL